MKLPDLYAVHQQFAATAIDDVASAVRAEFDRLRLHTRIPAGKTVAVAVGSRGISQLKTIVATTVGCLKSMGLKPFIMPAMGSHGGATGPGQAEILTNLGITEETVGVPVVSNMDVVSLGILDSGAEIIIARDAANADYLMVINRVKPHTAFRSDVESGLCKMLTIGCGKHKGAINIHKYSLGKTIVPGARRVMEKLNVLCGLAVVETQDHRIHQLRIVEQEKIEATDREFLKTAWTMLPRIPVEDLDFLIVDEMGKNISGAGIDPNVTGMWRRDGGERKPDYRVMAVLDVTPESHGNAIGIGMADLITARVRDMLNCDAMQTNALTSWMLRAVRIPMTLENDRVLIETVIRNLPDPETARIGRIKNTLDLETVWFSAPVLPEMRQRSDVVIDERARSMKFDRNHRLQPFP